MTGNCGSCQHWTSIAEMDNPGWDPDLRIVREEQAQANTEIGRCRAIDLMDPYGNGGEPTPLAEIPLAFTQDASLYSAVLWTRQTFGCVLFEEKPDLPQEEKT